MALTIDQARPFFDYARERHAIYLRRAAGAPRPWTHDPILQRYRFTNVFRELDKTTDWFRRHVREPLRDRPEVLLATVLFRMLNRIEVGEAIFLQRMTTGRTAWDHYLMENDTRVLRQAIVSYCGRGPYVTGAYIISTPPGMKKLDGVLRIVDNFARGGPSSDPDYRWRDVAGSWVRNGQSLQEAFRWLWTFEYLGTFHSYEIVTDLRHTALLERATDICTWANMGPGARRGLNRIHGRRREKEGRGGWGGGIPERQALEEMRELLDISRRLAFWPQNVKGRLQFAEGHDLPGRKSEDWPAWEMREVEHSLCEFDKMERVRLGEGTPRGRFA